MFSLFPGKVSVDYFGGPQTFYESLMKLHLIGDECNFCQSKDVSLSFDKHDTFPRAYCNSCHKRLHSLRKGSIFQRFGINNIPGFVFVANCFSLKVSFEATVVLSGLDESTVRIYLSYIRVMVDEVVDNKYRAMEQSLGGDEKIVEIDECFLTKRKYGRGRIPAKAQTIVFGMVERDGGPVQVQDPELYAYLLRKKDFREQVEARKAGKELRQQQEPPRTRCREDDVVREADEEFVIEGDFTTIINIGEESDDEDDFPDIEPVESVPPQTDQVQSTPMKFEFDTNLEQIEKKLFGTTDRTKRNNILFFVVKNRKARTLLPIIRRYVRPNSYIFSDKWSAYFGLRAGYKHYFVVHQRRFVDYIFLEHRLVVKVTTNHIERLWVDLRQILRGVAKEDIPRRISEVPYRLMTMVPGRHFDNLIALLRDLNSTVALGRPRTPSAFTPVPRDQMNMY